MTIDFKGFFRNKNREQRKFNDLERLGSRRWVNFVSGKVLTHQFAMNIMYFTVPGSPIGLARFRLPIAPFYLLVGAVYIDQFLNRGASRLAVSSQVCKAQAIG